METTTELRIWLEKALDACTNEGGANNIANNIGKYSRDRHKRNMGSKQECIK